MSSRSSCASSIACCSWWPSWWFPGERHPELWGANGPILWNRQNCSKHDQTLFQVNQDPFYSYIFRGRKFRKKSVLPSPEIGWGLPGHEVLGLQPPRRCCGVGKGDLAGDLLRQPRAANPIPLLIGLFSYSTSTSHNGEITTWQISRMGCEKITGVIGTSLSLGPMLMDITWW